MSSAIIEIVPAAMIVVEPATEPASQALVVEVVVPGPQGPPGLSNGGAFEHVQTSAAATWTIAHSFGRRPAISLVGAGGQAMLGNVIHLTTDTAQAHFDGPVSGVAICT